MHVNSPFIAKPLEHSTLNRPALSISSRRLAEDYGIHSAVYIGSEMTGFCTRRTSGTETAPKLLRDTTRYVENGKAQSGVLPLLRER
jgi:hypothetical protein